MLEKKITYTDFNGVERTETVRFNLSKSELIDMQFSKEGGLDVVLQEIIDSKNQQQIMKLFKQIILKAYGEKSEDGRHFKKSDAISEAFSQSAAYDALYFDLLTDTAKAADFIRDIISAPELKEAVEKARIESGIPSSEPKMGQVDRAANTPNAAN